MKTAGINNDLAADSSVGTLYTVGTAGVAPLLGTVSGLIRDPMSKEDEEKQIQGLSWLPGVADDRLVRRRTQLSKRLNAGKAKATSEQFGTLTSITAATLLGAGIGAAVTPYTRDSSMQFNAGKGAFLGGVSAATLALLMRIAGKASETRTDEEQQAYEQSTVDTLANWLVPGSASYNNQRSLNKMKADAAVEQQSKEAEEKPFQPINVGMEGQEEASDVEPVKWTRNGWISLGAAGLAGGLSYWLMRNRIKEKDAKKRKERLWRAALASTGIGLGTGAATFLALAACDTMRGTNMTHKYRIPSVEKDGKNPDVYIHFVGGGGGAQLDNEFSTTPNLDRAASLARFGANRTYLLNPNDAYYGEELLDRIHAAVPGARIRISGHSHGGAAAYRLASYAAEKGIPIDQLDTLDPIARLTPMSGKPSTTSRWNNYRLDEYTKNNSGNLWAILGGLKGKLEGSVDHVFKLDSPYNNHTEMRYVPFDDGTKPYNTYEPKSPLLIAILKRLEAESKRRIQEQQEDTK